RHRAEAVAVRAVLRLVRGLPLPAAVALSSFLGTLMRYVVPSRARVAREQMAAALGRTPDDPDVRAWTRQSFRHFIDLALVLLRAPARVERDGPQSLVAFEGRERLDAALARGRGVILLTGHFGNWELFGLTAALFGIPMVGVARPLKNRLLDTELLRLRSRFGQRLVSKESAALPFARALKQGECVTLLNDQHAGSRGLRVPFFHADASTYTMAAALARRFDAPIVPWFARVDGRLHVTVCMEEPLWSRPELDAEEDAYQLTRRFHHRLEAAIRADPGQYLWFHRRWKPGGREARAEWRARYDPAPA
ncbi:MAG: lysophospholipid acyltransferase family protein, partial [Planctomycetes bacterium]|nr:lysophospholipid acyltransferase family protein [Planctomycetota bacterium]